MAELSGWLEAIHSYDVLHGGAFYRNTDWHAVYGCLRTMEQRRLVQRHTNTINRITVWTITKRGVKALDGLKK